MLKRFLFLSISVTIIATSCNHKKETDKQNTTQTTPETPVEKRVAISYGILTPKDSIKKVLKQTDSATLAIIALVNRADKSALANFDSIIIPGDTKQTTEQYFPFPFEADFLKDVNKILFFSYPAQAFAAYEHGRLVYSGPTNMGRKADPTPTGLFYTNWKAEQTTSTFNDEWDLKWNFNIENKLGVGFHQYALPGYPASHSCLRLREVDAKYLYTWADQWKMQGTDSIIAHGTPVVVFGSYAFGSPRPWLALAQNKDALNISEADLETIGKQYIPDVMQKQAERQ